MTGPDEFQSQLWRRALLLTGRPEGAEWVLARVMSAHENLLKLSAHRRDRLTLQAAREWTKRARGLAALETPEASDPVTIDGAARQLWRAIRDLPRQPAEAWMLLEVEGFGEIDAARAMDCSRTAMNRHRDAAAASLHPLLGDDLPDAILALRAGLDAADSGPSLLEAGRLCTAARRRRRLVSLAQVLLFAACIGVLVWVVVDLLKANDRERERRDMADQYSLPIGTEAPPPPKSGPTK